LEVLEVGWDLVEVQIDSFVVAPRHVAYEILF
jgi:hypothetical protein